MPFTLAHPIATAPIWFGSNRKLDLPSLFVGSMMPDIDYFLTLHPIKTVGHTWSGILIQGLPYSIVSLLVIRYVLACPFLAFLPEKLSRKFPPPKSYFPLRISHLLNITISIAIGAASHLIFDSLTYSNGWLVVNLTAIRPKMGSVAIYQLLQYTSGIIGVGALLLWLFIWLFGAAAQSRTRPQIETLTPNWRSVVTVGIGCCALGLAHVAIEINHVVGETPADVFVRSLIGCISGTLLGLLLYSVVFWILDSFNRGSRSL
ncbi:DUF4184 family protein [Chamaesiphon sp. VAR_48_metabat_135_sub]|uniref:DUF4184 family protein n=1 Tax=Chamaesiphon sp. VAR_48_metabat_135_sub TaxID=2964699 RepID=UPI00286A83F5|nr:DUF4184 family protein [Chamaesiphon sp. VAR_48_metabat_135_sub]